MFKMFLLLSVGALAFLYPRQNVFTNNNPGNLRYVEGVNWIGQTGQDARGFAIFDTIGNGIRANAINARTHIARGKNTIAKLISIWAPEHENPTQAYIEFVCKRLKKAPHAEINFNQERAPLMAAIFRFETGKEMDEMTLQSGLELV